MAFYRCCKVEPTGKIILYESFQSPNDSQAIDHSNTLVACMDWPDAELWEGIRRVYWPKSK